MTEKTGQGMTFSFFTGGQKHFRKKHTTLISYPFQWKYFASLHCMYFRLLSTYTFFTRNNFVRTQLRNNLLWKVHYKAHRVTFCTIRGAEQLMTEAGTGCHFIFFGCPDATLCPYCRKQPPIVGTAFQVRARRLKISFRRQNLGRRRRL